MNAAIASFASADCSRSEAGVSLVAKTERRLKIIASLVPAQQDCLKESDMNASPSLLPNGSPFRPTSAWGELPGRARN